MESLFVLLVLALTTKAAVIEKVPPSMIWVECEGHQRCLEIDFHDGKPTDLALLDPIHKENDCVLQGRFRDEGTKVVVTEECPFDPSKEFEVSFASPRNPEMTFFKVQAGKTSIVQPRLNRGSVNIFKKSYDPVNESQIGNVPPIPKSGFSLSLRIYYDDSLYARFGGQTTSRIQAAMAHANNIFSFPSLSYPIRMNVGNIDYLQGDNWAPEGDYLDYLGYYHTNTGENLVSFWSTDDFDSEGVVGLAPVGVVCSQNPKDRISIIEFVESDLTTAVTFAHEAGHNLGMNHDFNDQTGGNRYCRAGDICTGIDGIMDYGDANAANKWSCCSNDDFYDYYKANSANWCLPGA